MRYKDYIKPGNKCIYVPSNHPFATDNEQFADEYDELFGNALKVVEISEYRPYFTNGLPDPTPEEYDSMCLVEVYCDQDGPIQAYFAQLLPLVNEDRDVTCVYENESCTIIGYDPNKEYYVIEYNGCTIVRVSSQVQEERFIEDLDFDELKELREQIVVGSFYLSDYRNTLGVSPKQVSDYADYYIEDLCRIFGEEGCNEHDTIEAFANFVWHGRSYPDMAGVYIIQVKFDGDSVWQSLDGKEYYDGEIEDALWDIKRAAMSSGYEFRKVHTGFVKIQKLICKV